MVTATRSYPHNSALSPCNCSMNEMSWEGMAIAVFLRSFRKNDVVMTHEKVFAKSQFNFIFAAEVEAMANAERQ